jgi:hypothetical protein
MARATLETGTEQLKCEVENGLREAVQAFIGKRKPTFHGN